MKTECHQIWVNFQVEHVVSYPSCQPLPEMIKVATMALLFKIETCDENQALLNFGESLFTILFSLFRTISLSRSCIQEAFITLNMQKPLESSSVV